MLQRKWDILCKKPVKNPFGSDLHPIPGPVFCEFHAVLGLGCIAGGQGKTVDEVCKEIDVTNATHYRWRKKYGGMNPNMIKQLKAAQKENAQLRMLAWTVQRVFLGKFRN